MNKKIAILGSGGHAKVVASIAIENGWSDIIFFDDAWPSKKSIGRWVVSGNCEMFFSNSVQVDGVIVAIGNNMVRRKLSERCMAVGADLVTLVHPKAIVSQYSTLGRGVVICAGAIVNVDTYVSDGVIVNTAASLDHDVLVGAYAHVCPNAALGGEVVIGEQAWLGIGASVRQCLRVGAGAIVGAGAAVVCDVPVGETWAGVPAKRLPRT